MTRIALLLVLGGCTSVDETLEDGLRWRSQSTLTGSQGLVRVALPVAAGEHALLVTARVDDPLRAFVFDVQAPDGRLVWDVEEAWLDPRLKSGGMFAESITSMNWPVLGSDRALSEGRWVLHVGVIDESDYYVGGASVDVDLLVAPAAASVRRLAANVILAGRIGADDTAVAHVEDAVHHWTQLYAQVGIDVAVTWFDSDADDLSFPGLGDGPVYESLSAGTDLRSINVVVVDYAAEGDLYLGLAGGIPGPLVSTDRSAITVSYRTHAGPDGRFSSDELRVLGETLAHEAGHFLGLFHPVETDFARWDAVDDTAECLAAGGCERTIGDNLMFPYAICDGSSCVEQHLLTSGQAAVIANYTGVQ